MFDGFSPVWATLSWIDHAVVSGYVLATLAIGGALAWRQGSDEEYFLAGRNMPWFAVGLSVIATVLSSITYVADPGEVWRSGETYLLGKMLAIPLEMIVVYCLVIPFYMRFRYTSAYEYLEDRFGPQARLLGASLFVLLTIAWMGIVLLVFSRVMSTVTGLPWEVVLFTVGFVATVYTMLGGVRAVIWTDVLQVALMLGGAFYVVGFIAWQTNSSPYDWHLAVTQGEMAGQALSWFSLDPFARATIFTVGLHMTCWHICTHVSNQMTVQRYFCTSDLRAARRSFVVASLMGVVINLSLLVVGMALFFYYQPPQALPEGIDPGLRGAADPGIAKQADEIFPRFVVDKLPPGFAGGVLAAMLAAAMSSVDSGSNSIAGVILAELEARRRRRQRKQPGGAASPIPHAEHIRLARILTVAFGVLVTLAAFALHGLTGHVNLVEMMPRSFNCFLGPMAGMFLVGMFVPRVNEKAIVIAALSGLAFSLFLAYSQEALRPFGFTAGFSFTTVVWASLLWTWGLAWALSFFSPPGPACRDGLTWWTRNHSPDPQ